MSSIPEDNFLTNDLFIRLCWSIYYKSSSLQIKESQFYKDTENLISLTNLNTQTLIHTLCYLYLLVNHKPCLYSSSSSSPSKLSSFQTSSRLKLLSSSNRKNDVELFELLVILFMISNKANDDSSYTLKTWSNLTPLTNTTLKKKELVVLKKIQYNVFLKNDEYTRWCGDVYKIGVDYQLIWNARQQSISISSPSLYNYPPTPKSPVQESYLPPPPPPQMSLQQPTYQVLQPIPITQLPQQSFYSTTSSYPPQKRSFNEFNSQTPYSNVSKKQQYESVYNTPTKIASISNYNMLTPIKSSYMTSNNHNTGVMIDNNYPINYNIQPPPPQQHPLNCSCCALTNFTNCYHSSLKSMVKL